MIYNCRRYDYPTGQHVTFYKKPIQRSETEIYHEEENEKSTNKSKGKKEKDKDKSQEQHCLKSSLSRTKNKVYNIARSNKWDWYVTLTFDRIKTDASDYDVVVKNLTQYLNNMRKWKAPDMKYMIVPELHADKKHYHFHGLFADCDGLTFIDSGIIDKKSNQRIYNLKDWTLGFTNCTKVQNTEKVSCYIAKYITKASEDITLNYLKGKRRYYSSRNLTIVEPEYFQIDEEEFQELYRNNITHMKTLSISEAHQQVTYYELKD